MAAAARAGVEALCGLGAEVVPVVLPELEQLRLASSTLILVELYSAYRRLHDDAALRAKVRLARRGGRVCPLALVAALAHLPGPTCPLDWVSGKSQGQYSGSCCCSQMNEDTRVMLALASQLLASFYVQASSPGCRAADASKERGVAAAATCGMLAPGSTGSYAMPWCPQPCPCPP